MNNITLPSHIQSLLLHPNTFESPTTNNQTHVFEGRLWEVSKLIELAKTLPAFRIPLTDLRAVSFNSVYPGLGHQTYLEIAYHARVAMNANLDNPIILGYDGRIMDGHHRVLKSLILGIPDILCVQFIIDPTPDKFNVCEECG